MKTIQEALKDKGFIDKDGEADINALNGLSAQTTMNFVYALRDYITEDKIEALSNIYEHLSFLYNEGNDDEAVRFISVLLAMSDIAIHNDVKLVLSCDTTKHSYLFEFIADFHEIVYDFRYEAGIEDNEGGEFRLVEYGSVAPSL